jgi:hypothetical protein
MIKVGNMRFWAIFWSFWAFGGGVPEIPIPRAPEITFSSPPDDDGDDASD